MFVRIIVYLNIHGSSLLVMYYVKLIITRKRVDLFCLAVSLIQSIASGSDRKTELLSPAFADGILLFYLA